MRYSESDKDVQNAEAWAGIVEDILFLVPRDIRLVVLQAASKSEEASQAEGPFHIMRASDLKPDPNWNAIMRLKSLIVQVFVRDIRNNHSQEDAFKLLFAEHPYGNGSRLLCDYLDDLCDR